MTNVTQKEIYIYIYIYILRNETVFMTALIIQDIFTARSMQNTGRFLKSNYVYAETLGMKLMSKKCL
jgi:hypothetical protein